MNDFDAGDQGPVTSALLGELLGRVDGGICRTLRTGEYLWREGDVADSVALLRAGTLEVVSAGGDGEDAIVLRLLQPGTVLGEIACLDGGGRSADIRAGCPSEVVCYPATLFRTLLRERPRVLEMLLLQQAETVRRLTAQVTQHHRRAITDPLTGLYNLAFFVERLALEIDRAQKTGDPLAVVMLDIDHFKLFNDRYGHQAGNSALVQVSGILRAAGRRGDIIARYGGEEFIALLYGAGADEACRFAERVRSRVQVSDFADDGAQPPRRLTVSAGVACYPSENADPDCLIMEADTQLYRAKEVGRDRVMTACRA
jgi:diguanylate cyclase (GGDEF)-like protein